MGTQERRRRLYSSYWMFEKLDTGEVINLKKSSKKFSNVERNEKIHNSLRQV